MDMSDTLPLEFPSPPDYWFRFSLLQQYRTRKTATKNHLDNLQKSAICRLPNELIAEITKHLGDADLLCLLSASKWFFGKLVDPDSRHVKKEFSHRLIRDLYNRIAPFERSQDFEGKGALCSSCYARHPMSCFSSSQLDIGSNTRVCKGAEGHFRVCAHKTYTLRELRDEADIGRRNPGKLGHHTESLCGKHTDGRYPELQQSLGRHSIILDLHLIEIGLQDHPLVSDVYAALEDLDEYVCPHLRTPDISECRPFSAPVQRDFGDGTNDANSIVTYWEVPDLECSEVDCDTQVHLRREFGVGQTDHIVLHIERELGQLKEVRSRNWLSQLEH
jgi:hypothetical protein